MQIRGTWSAGPGDDQARFLADLRALRDSAAIGYDELAARAHYPSDVLKEAENGPALPGLPILTAYVRACEGDVLDWEERWRRLNPEAPEDPSLPVRPAGASAAAVAGARAGIGVAPPDVYDPDRIKAALRGDHTRSDQVGRRSNDPGISAPPQSAQEAQSAVAAGIPDQGSGPDLESTATWGSKGSTPSWDAVADPGVSSANGNHSAAHGSRGPFDATFTSIPDSAEHTEPAQTEEFSCLKNSGPESPAAESETAWPERADAGFGWLDRPATGPTSAERTDFWGQPVPPAAADIQGPAAAPRTEAPPIPRASWPAADTTATPAAEPAHRAKADAAFGTATTAQSHTPAGSAAQATVTKPDERRQDRIFPARLLVVIVIAALIGSALVLLLK